MNGRPYGKRRNTPFNRRSRRLRWVSRYRDHLLLWVGTECMGRVDCSSRGWWPHANNLTGQPMRRRVDAKRWVECQAAKVRR